MPEEQYLKTKQAPLPDLDLPAVAEPWARPPAAAVTKKRSRPTISCHPSEHWQIWTNTKMTKMTVLKKLLE